MNRCLVPRSKPTWRGFGSIAAIHRGSDVNMDQILSSEAQHLSTEHVATGWLDPKDEDNGSHAER